MHTADLMQLALEMAGMDVCPADSAVYHPGGPVRRALLGIDMGVPELALARAQGYDAVIAHHPAGDRARLEFCDVLWTHLDQMRAAGVPEAVARPLVEEMVESAGWAAHAFNYDHAPSFARLLDMPYLNIHLPLDELGRQAMVAAAAPLGPEAPVSALIEAFKRAMPEFGRALTGIQVRVGSRDNPLGKLAVSHAAGTNGGFAIAQAYFDHGVDTVFYIHCSPQDSLRLREVYQGQGKNLVVGGHIASDAVGINRYADELARRGLEIARVSGVLG